MSTGTDVTETEAIPAPELLDPRDRERQVADMVARLCAKHRDGETAADSLRLVLADTPAPVGVQVLEAASPDPGAGLQRLAKRWRSPMLATLADAFGDGDTALDVDYLSAVAVATAVEHRMPTRLSLKRVDHPRHGVPWTDDEHQRLLAAVQLGASIEELCDRHQRNANAIRARLVKHGVIDDDRPLRSRRGAG